jgi:lipopolysaccharide export system protein LptA
VLGNATVEGGKACVFYGSGSPLPHDPDVAQADSVRVVVVEGSDATKWYDDYKSKVTPQAISGYGDQAYYDGYASFSVLKGDVYVRIAVSPLDAAPSLADEEKLMTAILPNV